MKNRTLDEYDFEIPLLVLNGPFSSGGIKDHDTIVNELIKLFNHDKPVKFKFESQMWHWNAMFDGPIEIPKYTKNKIIQFNLKVRLLDSYKYSDVEYTNTAISDQVSIVNKGTAETYPIVEARALKNSTSFMVSRNDEEFFMIGESEDAFKDVKDKTPIIYQTRGESVAGWQYLTQGTSVDDNITGGLATGSIQSNGSQIVVADYGTRTDKGWYGPAVKRSLSKPIQDFEITTSVKLFSRNDGVGKVFNHLYDDMGNIVCSLGLLDATNNKTNVRAYVSLHNQQGQRWEWYSNTGKMAYDDAYVYINVRRLGNNWRIKTWHYYIDDDGKRQITSRIKIFFNDTGNWYTAPIAQTGLHLARHSSYNFLPIHVNSISINEIIGGEEIPYIIKTGDEIYIDMNRELVLINNEDVLDQKTLGSDYFPIKEELSEMFIFPQSTFDTTVKWQDRFL